MFSRKGRKDRKGNGEGVVESKSLYNRFEDFAFFVVEKDWEEGSGKEGRERREGIFSGSRGRSPSLFCGFRGKSLRIEIFDYLVINAINMLYCCCVL